MEIPHMPKEIRQMIMEINTKEIKEGKKMANDDLFEAAQKGDIENVRLLLDRGANINFKNYYYGNTALMIASIYGNLDIVRLLLDRGADLDLDIDLQNNHGDTALMIASLGGVEDSVLLLLTANANPNIQNYNGDTALDIAVGNGDPDIVEILNRHKAYSNIQSRFRGRRTRRKIRTQKAKQMSSLAKSQDSIQGMTGQDLDLNIYKNISGLISNMPYNPEVSRRMLEEEQDDPYTEWLQDRSQLGSGQRSNRRKRSKRSRSKRSRRKYML